jgi:hypothetical protein
MLGVLFNTDNGSSIAPEPSEGPHDVMFQNIDYSVINL